MSNEGSATAQNRQRCAAIRSRDGQPCQALATSTGYCIAHRPEANRDRAKGGAATSNRNRAAKLLPSRLKPIVEGLERAFLAVEQTDFEPKRAAAMAALARALVAVFEASEFEMRLRFLEQQANDAGRFKDRYGNARGGPIQWPTTPA